MIELVAENINDFYELKDKERYTEEFGLDLNIENGMALFLVTSEKQKKRWSATDCSHRF